MSALAIGFIGLGVLIALLLLRLPIAVALGAVGTAGVFVLVGERAALGILADMPYGFSASWSLSSVPMFLLMGYFCYYAGLTDGLFRLARLMLAALPGGLAITTVVGAALFSAVSGSSVACAAAMGRIAVPEMLRYRYDPKLAAGAVAAAGTLGSLIPPSVIMIIYGIFAEVPIGQLFIAGVLPGLLTAANYTLTIVVRVMANPELAPKVDRRNLARERLAAVRDTWPVLLLIGGVFGGMFGGVFTPTEAGAAGALMSMVIALAKCSLTLERLRDALVQTATTTGALFVIAIGAMVLTRFMALSGVPSYLSATAVELGASPVALMIAISVVYVILGMFLDPLGIMLLTLPVLLPVMVSTGADLIWFGIILTKFLEIGLITPPIGLNVFVVKSVVGNRIPMTHIFHGVLWFVVIDLVTVALLIAFPQISLFLPSLMG